MSILIVFMLAVDVSWPVAVPITMEKNLPLVQMKVNGGEVLTFIVDSAAAGCVIDQERASALGLATSDRGVSSGSGGTQSVVLLKPVTLEAGGVEVAPPRCYGFDMKSLNFTGKVDGIIGHPLFVRYVVELDYPGLTMRLFELGSYDAPAVRFSRQTTGSFGSEKHYQGNLGGGFFKAHRVVFDFAAQKLVIH
jgi:hypothetical protein